MSPSSLKRYYFEKFLFNAVQLRVSVATVTKLPEDLKQIKSALGLILVRLQGAVLDLGKSAIFLPLWCIYMVLRCKSINYTALAARAQLNRAELS